MIPRRKQSLNFILLSGNTDARPGTVPDFDRRPGLHNDATNGTREFRQDIVVEAIARGLRHTQMKHPHVRPARGFARVDPEEKHAAGLKFTAEPAAIS